MPFTIIKAILKTLMHLLDNFCNYKVFDSNKKKTYKIQSVIRKSQSLLLSGSEILNCKCS